LLHGLKRMSWTWRHFKALSSGRRSFSVLKDDEVNRVWTALVLRQLFTSSSRHATGLTNVSYYFVGECVRRRESHRGICHDRKSRITLIVIISTHAIDMNVI